MADLEIRGGDRLRLTYHSPDVEQPRRANIVEVAGFALQRESAGDVEVQVLDRDGFEAGRIMMALPIMRALVAAAEELMSDPEVRIMAANDQRSGLVGMRRFIHRSLASDDQDRARRANAEWGDRRESENEI